MKLHRLALSEKRPIAHGKTRAVYEYPEDPSKLIKVHLPRELSDTNTIKRWFQQRQDWFLYRSGILRELDQFLASRYGHEKDPLVDHIAPIHGIVDTDIGLGFVVAAARTVAGELAPTVKNLRQSGGMTAERAQALIRLLEYLELSDLVVGDLNQDNIVLSDAGSSEEKFMIIDGLGERTWIPIQSWCSWASKRQKRAFVQKMRRRLQTDGYADGSA